MTDTTQVEYDGHDISFPAEVVAHFRATSEAPAPDQPLSFHHIEILLRYLGAYNDSRAAIGLTQWEPSLPVLNG